MTQKEDQVQQNKLFEDLENLFKSYIKTSNIALMFFVFLLIIFVSSFALKDIFDSFKAFILITLFVILILYVIYFIRSFKSRYLFYKRINKLDTIEDNKGNSLIFISLYLPYSFYYRRNMTKEIELLRKKNIV